MIHIKATIYLEHPFWVGLFERTDRKGFAASKHIFGAEPTDPEVYEFVLNHFGQLKFGEQKKFKLEIKRKNPKRVQREVRKEMEKAKEQQRPSTFAQDYMREELEKKKKERKKKSKKEKELHEKKLFEKKTLKRKEKRKGH